MSTKSGYKYRNFLKNLLGLHLTFPIKKLKDFKGSVFPYLKIRQYKKQNSPRERILHSVFITRFLLGKAQPKLPNEREKQRCGVLVQCANNFDKINRNLLLPQ